MSITIDDFSKVEIRIGTVLEATKVPDADKLFKLIFDFGPDERSEGGRLQGEAADKGGLVTDSGQARMTNDEGFNPLPELVEKYPNRDVRQIMSAIAPFIPDPETLVGKQIAVCVNLEPRTFRGYVSQGMIMATGENAETLSFLVPEKKVEAGSKVH